ncbi:hypothetical protein [Acidiphilium sp.]|uniref:hypothetical protein n=1 Tax=Acidiphilium sp. TaxID=527 RepID=UPI003D0658C2
MMLIHLRSIDGQPQITIDPEGEALPCIETLPWHGSSFRLTWSASGASGSRGGDGREVFPGDPRALHPTDTASPSTPPAKPGGRIGQFAAMTATFAGFLVVGMIIATVFRVGPSRGVDVGPRGIAAQILRRDIPYAIAPAPAADVAPPPAEIAAPYAGRPEPHVRVPPPEPARVAAPPPQLPPPPNPGVLFGLHS